MYPPPPPPPPPPPAQATPSRLEPYGAVQRRAGQEQSATAQSYYGGSHTGYTSYMGHMPPPPQQQHPAAPVVSPSPMAYNRPISPLTMTSPSTKYQHSKTTLPWILIPLLLLLWSSSSLLLQVFLFVSLALYAMDLANAKEATWSSLWLGWAVLSMTNAWLLLTNGSTLTWILRIVVDTLLFLCLTCWCSLQFNWLARDMPSLAERGARALHFMIPPVAASIVTDFYLTTSQEWGRVDRAATGAPHIWAIVLVAGMFVVGAASYSRSPSSATADGTEREESKSRFLLKPQDIRLHSTLLLFAPPVIYLVTFRRRVVSLYASSDEWYDLVLVCTVPYLLHYALHAFQPQGPYTVPWLFSAGGSNTLRGAFVPIVVSLVASLSVQQAYLIPLCQSISYQFNGHNVSSGFLVSFYLTLATVASLTAGWVWGRKSSQSGEPLFGDYHEDVVQLSLAATGLCLGKAVGMPWNMTPLPILAFLGLSVWISTRMLRYLAIFLFVVHSTGLVVFSYRFAGIHSTVAMSIPGVNLGLIRFGMFTVASSCLVGVVAGLAVRSGGGIGSATLKRFDIPGILLALYAVSLCILEATLLKCPIPFRELMGIESHDSEEDEEEMMYDPMVALMTSVVLAGITWFMQRHKIVSNKSAITVWSVSFGEALAVFVDMNEIVLDPAATAGEGATILLIRALAASLVLFVMLAPRAFLEPVHVKGGGARYKKALGPSGKPETSDAPNAEWAIVVYSMMILPATLVASVPLVLKPLVSVLAGHYSGAYYISTPAPTELVGFALSLWGASSLSMINHYLPDGGAEAWKRVAALAFLMGIGVAISAPALPGDAKASLATSNPYASISSTGALLVTSGRTRMGGWGLVSATLATVLAIAGPLELRERRDGSRQKDTLVLFRLMVFSLMFGCGVSWFITLEFMSEEGFLAIFVTATACMAMSFFGTVVCVLGYFLELQNFDEAVQVAKVWAGAFPVFGILAGTTQFVRGAAHPFGMGGWLSTYLTMCCFVTLVISIVVKFRSTKNVMTRGLGNLSCLASYLCSVVVCYGRYGVAGLDVSFEMVSIFGISASVLGTFLTSLILLALEGEIAAPKRGKIQRLAGSTRGPAPSFGVTFSALGPSNALAPPITATVVLLTCASVYTIFLRGSGSLLPTAPTSARDVFAGVHGTEGLAAMAAADELAAIVEKNIMHSQAIAISAKLAGSGFWTADSFVGPLLHLGGLVATLPSLYLLVTHMWANERIATSKIILTAPLNLIPLLLCRGIPTLQAAALIGLVGGGVQFFQLQRSNRQSKMRI